MDFSLNIRKTQAMPLTRKRITTSSTDLEGYLIYTPHRLRVAERLYLQCTSFTETESKTASKQNRRQVIYRLDDLRTEHYVGGCTHSQEHVELLQIITMSGFRARRERPQHYADDICSALGRGYTWFSIIRCILRVCACVVDCVACESLFNPTNTDEKFSIVLPTTTMICLGCWAVKLFITCIDCCRCDDLENISEWFSLITLWLGEIPKTALHLIIACTKTHTFHKNNPISSVLLTSFKLVERVCGYRKQYDWRHDSWSQEATNWYIIGIMVETITAFFSIVLAFK